MLQLWEINRRLCQSHDDMFQKLAVYVRSCGDLDVVRNRVEVDRHLRLKGRHDVRNSVAQKRALQFSTRDCNANVT